MGMLFGAAAGVITKKNVSCTFSLKRSNHSHELSTAGSGLCLNFSIYLPFITRVPL